MSAPSLDGRVAIVTGGTRGIGAAVAAWLAERGARVMVSGRDADRMQSALKAMEGLAGRVVGLAADAAKREDADRLVDAARQ